ncbi:DUF7521 family protein [Haloarcula sp. GH36]|uniref:DUF7521 family protein n=1 Tax=Haloarcula montana TaxID=3111776 RepID=UPI002D76E1F8|nr:hypothetical protein [Haloarcula sp. GH36]
MQVAGIPTDIWWLFGRGLMALSLVVGLGIFGLAFYGYRRNDSRSMLFLGSGIVTLTVLSWAGTVFSARYVAPAVIPTVSSLFDLAGMAMILYAMVLARRE